MRRLLVIPILLLWTFGFASAPASAQATATDSITDIVDDIESTGRFIDPLALPLGDGVEAAIDRANAAGVAIAIPDPATNAEALAPALNTAMLERNSRYDSIFVMTPSFIAAEVADLSDIELNQAFDASDAGYLESGDAGAIDGFVAALSGEEPSATTATTVIANDANGTTDSGTTSADNGGGFPWFWAIVAVIAGFFGVRYFSSKRKRQSAEHATIEKDRVEIAEQLRNNADRVIELGDPVIASRDPELIALYEEASSTYQEVSLALPEATTAAEIDALDDRIDNAEWQFEVIVARLASEPDPPSPAERERAATPPAPTGPALGHDESIFGQRPGAPAGSRLPPPQPQPRQRATRSSGGMGGMGGMLGSILGSILLGGGGRPRTVSRRTQRRTVSLPTNRSGSSFPDPFSKTRRSSGRSLGRDGGRSSRSRSSGSRSSGRRASGSRARSSSRGRASGSRRR